MKAFWKYFACDVLNWHAHPRVLNFPGEGHCPRCGALVFQNAQGKWFGVK